MLRIFRIKLADLAWKVASLPTDRSFGVEFGHKVGDGCIDYYVVGERLHRWATLRVVFTADRFRLWVEPKAHPACTYGAVCGQPDCPVCSLRETRRPTSRRLVLKRGPARVGTRIYSYGVVAVRIRRRFHTLGL